jgi:DNA (cytosine-5)-methyltransferase 1
VIVLDLFSGIGGFSLGFESCGMRTAAFCERDPFAAGVLRHHWPDTPIYDDVRHVTARRLADDGIPLPDLICGGFPCQPFSVAGKRSGTNDERHLWPEFARIVGETRPAWVVAENVPGIRSLAADGVCADLEALGYACWPVVVGAGHAGAPHRRARVWFVAYADRIGKRTSGVEGRGAVVEAVAGGARFGCCGNVADAHTGRRDQPNKALRAGRHVAGAGGADVGYTDGARLAHSSARRLQPQQPMPTSPSWRGAEPGFCGMVDGLPAGLDQHQWAAEWEGVPRVARGVPKRVDRLRCLGNAVVPQVVAMIGAWIMQQEDAA